MNIMKKFLLLIAVALFATSAFAQDFSLGARVGSGFQAVAQYNTNSSEYLEARFGASWTNPTGFVTADFTALYNWRVAEMGWTPSTGLWFVDLGAGVNVGGRENYAYVGAAGMARLGVNLGHSVALSLDWTPAIGPRIFYAYGYSAAEFNAIGLANVGLSCTYRF